MEGHPKGGVFSVNPKYPNDDYETPVNFYLANAIPTDVQYAVYKTKEKSTKHTTETIAHDKLDPTIPSKFLIHGWHTSEKTSWYEQIKDAYFQNGPHNIVCIDWSAAGNQLYSISAPNTKPIGGFIAEFIVACGIHMKQVHILGHSLGSMVAGFVGKRILVATGQKVGRITLLDPSGPKWEDLPINLRADRGDAEFVDVVHTDIGNYGFTEPIGHADFYPNGGKRQPGCPSLKEDDNCSHTRSVAYFIESITTEIPFVGKCANSWQDYLHKKYTSGDIIFGEKTPSGTRGKIYFRTNTSSPFAMGVDKD